MALGLLPAPATGEWSTVLLRVLLPNVRPIVSGNQDLKRAIEDLSGTACAGFVGVCGWLAAGYHYHQTLGGQPMPVTVLGRDWAAGILLSRNLCCSARAVPLPARSVVCSGPFLGEFSWGNWIVRVCV